MGIHHAWGRTFKDVVQRYRALCGYEQRFQNGFDCQGLWVEVEVEKTLGFNSKREIESFGLERFSRACRERVMHFAPGPDRAVEEAGPVDGLAQLLLHDVRHQHRVQLGFLKRCHERGWLYTGHRPMPWCTRCGTSISQHEMLDAYAELTHESVTVALPLLDRPDHRLLVWTTTPWTLPANVAVAVHPELDYAECERAGTSTTSPPASSAATRRSAGRGAAVKGAELVGLRYVGPFDELPVQRGIEHRVIPWEEVSAEEGTGIVHIAPGCGLEDFDLGRRHGLPVIAPVDPEGRYLDGLGSLSGTPVVDAAAPITRLLKERHLLFARGLAPPSLSHLLAVWPGADLPRRGRVVPRAPPRSGRWPGPPTSASRGSRATCSGAWTTGSPTWATGASRASATGVCPCPSTHAGAGASPWSVRAAELRGLAMDPAAVDAVPELHRPWLDDILIRCPGCAQPVRRIPEVGDCWLDAGIVPFSTLGYLEDRPQWERWFPADFIVEAVGQLRGWFYAMLFMSTALEGTSPYRTVLAHERVLAADGREMHKSWGNAVWLDDALEKMGPDVIRHMFASQTITEPIRFSFEAARDVKRRFLTFWNVYSLFVTYANLDRPPLPGPDSVPLHVAPLEQWLLSRLQATIAEVRLAFDTYQIRRAVTAVDAFVHDDLSNWYVRRRRREFWKGTLDREKEAAFQVLYHVLVRVCQLLAPVMPFITEQVYQNLVRAVLPDAPVSLHLTAFPEPDPARAHA